MGLSTFEQDGIGDANKLRWPNIQGVGDGAKLAARFILGLLIDDSLELDE
jgi:hypothetical protein